MAVTLDLPPNSISEAIRQGATPARLEEARSLRRLARETGVSEALLRVLVQRWGIGQ